MRWYKLLSAWLFILVLTGCWDKLELEEQAYTVVLGIDKARDHMISVTFQIANPQVGSSDTGSAPNEPSSDTITFTSPDVISAKEMANSVITRKISFAHLRTLIVGEEFAKSEDFHRIISASIQDPEMRREINLIVTKEKASDFMLQNKPKLETRPHKYFAFMQDRWRDTGSVPYSTLNRYFTRLTEDTIFLAIYATTEREKTTPKKDEDNYMAGNIPQGSGDPAQLMGSAVFKGGKMIGKMTGEETRFVLFLRRKSLAHSFISTFPDPLDDRYRVSVRLMKSGNTKVRVRVLNNSTVIHVTVPIRMQLLSTPSFINYALNMENQKVLVETIGKRLDHTAESFVKKVQRVYKADPFLWNLSARTQFWTRNEFEAYDWGKHFPKAEVNVHYDIKLESFGKQFLPPKVMTGDGTE